MNTVSIRARNIGEILDGAFRLYRQDIGLYALTAIMAAIPLAMAMVLLGGGADPTAMTGLGVLLLPVGMLASIIVWAALVDQMNERLEGGQPTLGPSIRRAFRLTLRIVWAGIIAYVLLVAVMMVVIFGAMLVGGLASVVFGDLLTGLIAFGAGLLLALTLGLRVFAAVMLFIPGIIAENLTGYGSIRRGFVLTKKGPLRVAGIFVVAWILIFLPVIAIYALTAVFGVMWDPEAAATGTMTTAQVAVQQLLTVITSGFTTPLLAASVLLLYYDQRVRLEAFDLEAEAGALAD